MRKALYCATPYHIIISIMIAINKSSEDDKFDLYLLNHFEDAPRLIKKLQDIDLFDNVYLIDQKSTSFLGNVKRLAQIIFPPRVIKNIASKIHYAEFYFFALDFINISLIVKKSIKANKNCVFLFAEDGIGSYVGKIYKPKPAVSLILKCLRRDKYIDKIEKLALIEPDLLSVETSREIVRISLVDENQKERFTNYIIQLWPEAADITSEERYIFFQSVASEIQSEDYRSGEQSVFQVIKDLEIGDRTVFKPHPRELSYFIPDVGRVMFDKRPFEALVSKIDLNEKVLITSISSCMYTAYLIFQQYPKVVVINNIINEKDGIITKEMNEFLTKLSLILPQRGLLLVPKDLNEFTEIIRNSRAKKSD